MSDQTLLSQNEKARAAQNEKVKDLVFKPNLPTPNRNSKDCKLCNGMGVKGGMNRTGRMKACRCIRYHRISKTFGQNGQSGRDPKP